jgi:hypothetical protein
METLENPPKTQTEKDIFNLKHMLYGIKHGSRAFRWGHVATLQRAIKRLEEIDHAEKETQTQATDETRPALHPRRD